MFDKQRAMQTPDSVFTHPDQVLQESSLSLKEKRDILHRWAYDVNELSVAEEENMPRKGNNGDKNYGDILQKIHLALAQLGDEGDEGAGHTSKHGS